MNKTNLFVVSVGVSIVSRIREKDPDMGMPPPGRKCEDWLKKRRSDKAFMDRCYEMVRADPGWMSAELNTLNGFLKRREVDEAYLVATDTQAGAFCCEIIEKFLKNEHGVQILGGSGPLLGYYKSESPEEFSGDLLKLFTNLVGLVRKHKKKMGKRVSICATGGFKAEMAVFSLVGNLFGVPVYYLHESFKEVVGVPPLIPLHRVVPSREWGEFLEKIYEKKDQRVVEPECGEMVSRLGPEALNWLEDFMVVKVKRDKKTGKPYEISLTPQGKFWVEISQEVDRP